VSDDFLETVENILAIQRQLEPGNSRALFVTFFKYRTLAGGELFESDRTKQAFDRWFNEIVGFVKDALLRGDPEAPGMVDLLYGVFELDNGIMEDMSRRSLVLRQEQLPPGAPKIRENIVHLAKVLIDSATHSLALGRHDDGNRSYTEAFSLLREADAKKELTESRWEVVDSLVGLKRYREADIQLEALIEEGTTVRGLTRCVFVDRAKMRVLGDYELDVAVDMLRDHMEHDHPLATSLDTYWLLGQAHEQLQQLDAARDAYLLALEINPDSLRVQSALRLLRAAP
jgi:tetratricopeptide (TPR) repeat protein